MPGPVDERFFDTAPVRFREVFDIARPAEDVWRELTADKTLAWCRTLDIDWTSPRPFGVGTTRRAKVLRVLLTIHEEFFVWDEGRRMAFFATSAAPPMFKRFAEDYVVEPAGADACRFTWTVAGEPTLLGKAGAPVNARIVRSMFADTRRHFAT